MIVHDIIAGTGVVGISVPVVLGAGIDSHITFAIVGTFVSGTQSEVIANGVSQTDNKLPRSIEIEVVTLANPSTGAVAGGAQSRRRSGSRRRLIVLRIVAGGKVVPYRRVDIQTDTER